MPRTTTTEPTQDRFLKDIASHRLIVERDDGLYRHLKFRGSSFAYWFDLVTWPGVLTIHGDMGTYAFRRIEDMFHFFRRHDDGIDLYYWSQKCVCVDRNSPIEEYDAEVFKSAVEQWMIDDDWPHDVREAARRDIFWRAEDGEILAIQAAMDFRSDCGKYRLDDFYEVNCKSVTLQFVWCCRAIAWGIRQYDALKEVEGGQS